MDNMNEISNYNNYYYWFQQHWTMRSQLPLMHISTSTNLHQP